jgi:hypothetical protein
MTGASAMFAVTEEYVQRMAGELADTASHPEFLTMIDSAQRAVDAEKIAVAKDVARVDQVAARGIPVPDTFRLTTRTFEDPQYHLESPIVQFDGHRGSVEYRGVVVSVTEGPVVPGPMSSESVKAEIKNGVEEIGRFVASSPFQMVLGELARLEADARPQFIADELLDPTRRARRGLVVPDGMHVQRSEFADGRPTLFCVSKVLPFAYPWHKVTITFDNP